MTTLARRHFQRVTAAQASASAADGEPIDASAYELMLAKLAEDKRRLKEIQSVERKIEVKRKLLPDYEPWVEGVLEAGRGGQDAVLMTVMVWKIDTGDFAGALHIAAYALRYGLVLPDQYKRDVPTLVAEEIAEQALAAHSAGGDFDLGVLADAQHQTEAHDMPDEVRAKLAKAMGLFLARAAGEPPHTGGAYGYLEGALEHLRRAVQLHDRVGVKKDIERLERAMKQCLAQGDATESTRAESSAAETGASGDTAQAGQPGAPAPATSG